MGPHLALWRSPDDLMGTARTLDMCDGAHVIHSGVYNNELAPTQEAIVSKVPIEHGVISRSGFSVVDDSHSMVLTEDGWIAPREEDCTDLYFFGYGHRYLDCLKDFRSGFSVVDDSHSMVLTEDGWIAPREEDCTDLYFFGYGHRYLDCLKDFYYLCGKTPLLPRYALGNWWSRYHRYTEAEYKELVERFEAEKLPFSVAVIDMDWHLVDDVPEKYGSGWTGYTWNKNFFPDPEAFMNWLHEQFSVAVIDMDWHLVDDVPEKYGSGWTGYTWNKNFFPDPEAFMNWLHEHHMKVTLNVHPADGIRAYEERYPEIAEKMGIDPATEHAVMFDPADPHFMEVYLKDLHHPLEEEGVDFWWLDWQQGGVTKVPGLDPLWMLNHYHYLDSQWKGNRSMTFSRYAGVGSHRYPIGFSGDTVISWESLQFQPYFTNTASNIGYGWWSHDIGGHMLGVRDDELMARWVQYGVFSPINRLHSTDNPFNGKEPWKFNKITQAVMENYLRLRHGLVPYLYTMNRRASREDLPLIQPLYYLEPEQNEAYEVKNEYYFGSEAEKTCP